MQVKELGHLVLYVRDLARSSAFYRDVLGWRQIVPPEGNPLAFPDAAPVPAGRRVGMYHFGLKVGDSDDELREAQATVRANSVTIVGMSDHTVTHSLYIEDPDGNEIELYIDVPGVD